MFRYEFWRTAARIGWRDLRASRAWALFLIVVLAVSIGAAGGVYGAAQSARAALRVDSRVWLGADIAVNTGDPLDDVQIAALDGFRKLGAAWTLMISVATMARSAQTADPAVVKVQAVDPDAYPFYGSVQLNPGWTLRDALRGDSVAVSTDLLERLQVRTGDEIRLGGHLVRVTAVIQSQPDRFTASLGLGPRCLMSVRTYERSGIGRSGASATYRALLRLPEQFSIEDARRRLSQLVPEGDVLSYRESNRHAVEIVETVFLFLSIASLLGLMLGAVGVAFACREHLERRLDSFAIFKALGASSGQTTAVFALELAGLLGCALLGALPVLAVVRSTLLLVGAGYLFLPPTGASSISGAWQAGVAGIAAAVPALFDAVLWLRYLRPWQVLRRDAQPREATRRPAASLSLLVVLLVFGGLAAAALRSLPLGMMLLTTVVASTALMAGAVALLLWLLRLQTNSGFPRHARVRIALRNLSRGRASQLALLLSLSVASMVLTATLFMRDALARVATAALPFERVNLLVLGVEESHQAQVRAFLANGPGVEGPVEDIQLARLRLARVNGVPVEELGEDARADAFVDLAGCDAGLRPGTVEIASDVARVLGARVGTTVEFAGRSGRIQASVVATPVLSRVQKSWRTFALNCRGLSDIDVSHQFGVSSRNVAALHRALAEAFPAVPALTAAEVVATVDGVSRDLLKLMHAVAWCTMISAAFVAVCIVSTSRARLLREMGLYSALGARPRTIVFVYSLEFAAAGAISGMLGALAAIGLSTFLFRFVFHLPSAGVSPSLVGAVTAAAALLSLIAGWLPSYRLLKESPLAVLRIE